VVATVVPAIGAVLSKIRSDTDTSVEVSSKGVSIVFTALDKAATKAVALDEQGGIKAIEGDLVGESDPETQRAVMALNERLRAIEDRFPDSNLIDKLSSVNDAIMATKLEELQRSFERLEKRLDAEKVSKWDVATIVFTILGSLGAIVGLIFGIIKFVQG
jgi:hypothetical protein